MHPVYEGRLFRWGHDPSQPGVVEYGRTVAPAGLVLGAEEERAAASWRASPFFHMLQTGETVMRLTEAHTAWFPVMQDYIAAGMKGGAAIVNRFAAEGVIGEMDAVYSTWMTTQPGGFSEPDLAVLERLVPTLALAVKTAALTRMTGTLMETYLGRDAARRVLSGPHHARRRRPDRRRDLVQRPARLHTRHRFRARAGHSAAERLCRRHRLGDPCAMAATC